MLRDPRADQISLTTVRYVGKTIAPLRQRLKGHLSKAANLKSDKYNLWVARWIRTLAASGLCPTISVIEEVGADWAVREAYWIAHCREIGAILTNLTAGGEGTYGRKATQEQRENCRLGAARRWSSEEQREIARVNALQQYSDPEQVEALRQRSLNRSPETIEKIRAAAIAQVNAPGGIERMQEMAQISWTNPESRAKLLAARQRVWVNPEFRISVSRGVSQAWTDPDIRQKFLVGISKRPVQSKASREKAAAANRGQVRSPEARARISAGCFAREARKRALREQASS